MIHSRAKLHLHQMPRLDLTFQFGRDVVIKGRIDRGIDGNSGIFHSSILAQTC